MNITKKRYLALLLAVVMIFSTITPNMVFAAGSDTIVYGSETIREKTFHTSKTA